LGMADTGMVLVTTRKPGLHGRLLGVADGTDLRSVKMAMGSEQ